MDAPRLLHRNSTYPHASLGTGYTDRADQALAGEPEAVSAEVQTFLTARVRRSERQTQLAEWDQRRASIQREMDWLHGQRFHTDVSHTLRTLRRQLERLDKQIAGR